MRRVQINLIVFMSLAVFCLAFTAPEAVSAQTTANGVCVTSTANSVGGTWESRAATLSHRAETTSAVLDDKLYIAGGLAGPSNFFTGITTSFEVYDPILDQWKELAPIPKPLHHAAIVGANGHIYLTGGYTALNFIANVTSAWAYDPQTNTWATIADLPGPRAAHTMAAINSIIYLVGGITSASTALWSYDPVADKWNTQHQPMPTGREHTTSAVVDGKLYVIGGEVPNPNGGGAETYMRLNTNEVYDPVADQWKTLAPMPIPESDITSGIIDGKIHVASGENNQDSCVFAQHEVYDPKTDQWSAMADMLTPRHGAVSGVIGGKWYLVDGATKPGIPTISTLTNKVEVFTPGTTP